jgi:hypothetical protein
VLVLVFVFLLVMVMRVIAVMQRVGLAGFGGMVMGMMAVAGGAMGVMRRDFRVIVFVMLRRHAVMVGGLLVMVGGVVMVLAGGMLVVGHGETPWLRPAVMAGRAAKARRGFATLRCRRLLLRKFHGFGSAATEPAETRHQTVAYKGFDPPGYRGRKP